VVRPFLFFRTPLIRNEDLDDAYREMAADVDREVSWKQAIYERTAAPTPLKTPELAGGSACLTLTRNAPSNC
jgi:hypothetical protein